MIARDRARGAAAYARRIEQALQRLAERPMVFSPRDWELARRWFDAGIPVGLVLEILEERGPKAARGLGSVAGSIEESWRLVREGRIPREPSTTGTDVPDLPPAAPTAPFREAAGRTAGELSDVLLRAAERLARGEPRAAVDPEVDRAVLDASGGPRRAAVAQEAERRLAPLRGRVPPAEWTRARDRAVVDRLRADLGLPPTHAT